MTLRRATIFVSKEFVGVINPRPVAEQERLRTIQSTHRNIIFITSWLFKIVVINPSRSSLTLVSCHDIAKSSVFRRSPFVANVMAASSTL